MSQAQSVHEYERRLKQLPKISKQIEEEIRSLQCLVQQQQSDINTQSVKIKLMEQQLGKLDKVLQTRENEIQELAESEEKSAQKEKKYFMQIQNYNKKIENLKADTAKVHKNTALLKKETKLLQTSVSTANSDKNKVLQQLTKGQLKINSMTQTLNELKVRAMEKASGRLEEASDGGKREQKQLNDLFLGIKKQMQLIDVLKKQKVHLVASTIFKYCEQDFEKLLEMKTQH